MKHSFQSQSDPEVLAALLIRSIGRAVTSIDTEELSVTQERLKGLRTTMAKPQDAHSTLQGITLRVASELLSGIRSLFAVPSKKVIQCENYGHVILSRWETLHPKCTECGAKIMSPEDLRRAYLK